MAFTLYPDGRVSADTVDEFETLLIGLSRQRKTRALVPPMFRQAILAPAAVVAQGMPEDDMPMASAIAHFPNASNSFGPNSQPEATRPAGADLCHTAVREGQENSSMDIPEDTRRAIELLVEQKKAELLHAEAARDEAVQVHAQAEAAMATAQRDLSDGEPLADVAEQGHSESATAKLLH